MDTNQHHPFEQIALKWFEAFNDHDVENLLVLYHENATHYSPKLKVKQPETKGLIIGKPALRSWWKSAFDSLPNLHYEVTSLTANDKRIFMEYIRQVSNEEDLMVGEVLEIENNLIVASKVYHG